MVSVAIILLLIAAITAVAGPAIYQQRLANTRQIMQNTTLALNVFETEDPLRALYGSSFGALPPYQLQYPQGALPIGTHYVGTTVEPRPTLRVNLRGGDYKISRRLYADLSGDSTGNPSDSWLTNDVEQIEGRGADDNIALYSYLRVWSNEALKLIPPNALKPFDPNLKPAINPGGSTAIAYGRAGSTWVDVLGIHDAWGVPLDYMIAVKLEWNSALGGGGFSVKERKPILRSRGVERSAYDAAVKRLQGGAATTIQTDPSRWVFSDELPRPWAKMVPFGDPVAARTGLLPDANALTPIFAANGWVRAVGTNEDYFFTPDQDP
jgi:hypothetical protein